MKFTDTQLQACFERNFAEARGASEELGRIGALLATHDWFRMMEGSHSPRVHETIEHLLSSGLRPVLRSWYHRSGGETNLAAIEFRDHLSQLAGESFQ